MTQPGIAFLLSQGKNISIAPAKALYNIAFDSTSETLSAFGNVTKHPGLRLGIIAML
jgi:hypothetical protein